jgi:hypothetical protein
MMLYVLDQQDELSGQGGTEPEAEAEAATTSEPETSDS